MKKVLIVEVKDNRTIATLSKVKDGNFSLLHHKIYGSKPLLAHHLYDEDIPKKIKDDLREINIYRDIDESYLVINTQQVALTHYNIDHKFDADVEAMKENFTNKIVNDNGHLHFSKITFTENSDNVSNKSLDVVVEAMPKDYLNEIIKSFRKNEIVFTRVSSILDTIKDSMNNQIDSYGSNVSILVEEKFTQLTWNKNGKIISSVKWKLGLTDIYSHISKNMGISKQDAKKLFRSYGSIPPESVVDNKIIHANKRNGQTEIFTKRNLSEFITEKVQQLFSNVVSHIEGLKQDGEKISILFNGEIQALNGFKKFASVSFGEPDIKKYKTDVIGLLPETEFITMGLLSQVNDWYEVEKDKPFKQRVGLLSKMKRMYSYI